MKKPFFKGFSPAHFYKGLPKQKIFSVGYEPEYYGAAKNIANLYGRTDLKPYAPKSWVHGWVFVPLQHEKQILHWGKQKEINLVHRKDQEEFLKKRGFKFTQAVGAPFIYQKQLNAQRLPNSLLIMPPHSTRTTLEKYNEMEYLDSINDELKKFEIVIFSIHPHDAETGAWVKNVRKLGYQSVIGCTVEDENSLERARYLFESFEYVSSPNLGSHLPYAAYVGSKISIFGTKPKSNIDNYKNDEWSRQNWEVVKYSFEWCESDEPKKTYPFLFCQPSESTIQQKWAKEVLGEQNKKCIRRIARIFGWTFGAPILDAAYGKRYAYKFCLKNILISK